MKKIYNQPLKKLFERILIETQEMNGIYETETQGDLSDNFEPVSESQLNNLTDVLGTIQERILRMDAEQVPSSVIKEVQNYLDSVVSIFEKVDFLLQNQGLKARRD